MKTFDQMFRIIDGHFIENAENSRFDLHPIVERLNAVNPINKQQKEHNHVIVDRAKMSPVIEAIGHRVIFPDHRPIVKVHVDGSQYKASA